jgi:hypothetical protein
MTILDIKIDMTDLDAIRVLVNAWVGTELFRNKSVRGARDAAASIVGPLETLASGAAGNASARPELLESAIHARREIRILFQRVGHKY